MCIRDSSGITVINGLSNTSWLQVPINELPTGTDGQSYHPYKTNRNVVPGTWFQDFTPSRFDYVPNGVVLDLPEGAAALGVMSDQLMSPFLNTATRTATHVPGGTGEFGHYMTEHGYFPGSDNHGITDGAVAMNLKTKALLRYTPFWLNKGIRKIDTFVAWNPDATGMGIMDPADPAGAPSQPLTALHNMVSRFAGAQPLASTRPLGVSVTNSGPQPVVFPAAGGHQALPYRDLYT